MPESLGTTTRITRPIPKRWLKILGGKIKIVENTGVKASISYIFSTPLTTFYCVCVCTFVGAPFFYTIFYLAPVHTSTFTISRLTLSSSFNRISSNLPDSFRSSFVKSSRAVQIVFFFRFTYSTTHFFSLGRQTWAKFFILHSKFTGFRRIFIAIGQEKFN